MNCIWIWNWRAWSWRTHASHPGVSCRYTSPLHDYLQYNQLCSNYESHFYYYMSFKCTAQSSHHNWLFQKLTENAEDEALADEIRDSLIEFENAALKRCLKLKPAQISKFEHVASRQKHQAGIMLNFQAETTALRYLCHFWWIGISSSIILLYLHSSKRHDETVWSWHGSNDGPPQRTSRC